MLLPKKKKTIYVGNNNALKDFGVGPDQVRWLLCFGLLSFLMKHINTSLLWFVWRCIIQVYGE